jgi:hypothetical protein
MGQLAANIFGDFPASRAFMKCDIVHDNSISRTQIWTLNLSQPNAKIVNITLSMEIKWNPDFVAANSRNNRHSLMGNSTSFFNNDAFF